MERLVGELKDAVASLSSSDGTASESTSSVSSTSTSTTTTSTITTSDGKASAAIATLAQQTYTEVAQGWSNDNSNGSLLSASA
jgi:hypothetical protein